MAPFISRELSRDSPDFREVVAADIDGHFPVVVYESCRTGLKVAFVQAEGPLVSGYLALATEAGDDDGLPHALEHLVFMGSEKYPWKGVLDLFANRCFASGTNAWTDVDHTCYTLTTAGVDGFCNLLPIYLDHILFPTLTDSAFLTEVHHVNGDGEDAGVVYAEMQSKESARNVIVHRTLMSALYPGRCGYNAVTGGRIENLRESTTNEKVRRYHRKFYCPENLWVIVSGQVDHAEVLASIDPVENKILDEKRSPPPFEKPWSRSIGALTRSVTKEVLFPADDEAYGSVAIGLRGPCAVTGQETLTALWVLFDYLALTPISPLQMAFVEVESPLASDVSFEVVENAAAALTVHFSDVPVDSMAKVPRRFWSIVCQLTNDTLDMSRIRNIIQHKIVNVWNLLESDPHSVLSNDLIGYMLYGRSARDLESRLNTERILDELKPKNSKFWLDLLHVYFDEARPHVVVLAKPSVDLKRRRAAEEKERVGRRVTKLGADGLLKQKYLLEQAVAANKAKPQPEVLASVPVSRTNRINLHTVTSYANFPLPGSTEADVRAESPYFDLEEIPVRMRLDDVKSKFVEMYVIIDTSTLPAELRPYLPLFLEAVVESPIRYPPGIRWRPSGSGPSPESGFPGNRISTDPDGCQWIPYEFVVAEIEAGVQSLCAYLGVGGGGVFSAGYFSTYAVFFVRVESQKYVEGIRWLRDLLFFAVMDPTRLQVIACKIAQSVGQKKQDGNTVLNALITDMDYAAGTNQWAVSLVRQQKFLAALSQRLQKSLSLGDPGASPWQDPAVLALTEVQRFFRRQAGQAVVHVAADLELLFELSGRRGLERPWLSEFLPHVPEMDAIGGYSGLRKPFLPCSDARLLAAPPSVRDDSIPAVKRSCIVGMGSVDCGYLRQTVHVEIQSFLHSAYPALILLLQYLEQLEGPLWRALRGRGLAYDYFFRMNPEEGLLEFHLGACSHVVEAYRVVKEIVEEHLGETFSFDEKLFESARSSLVFNLIEAEASVRDVVHQSVLSLFRGIPPDYSRTLIDKVWTVSSDEARCLGAAYLTALFDPRVSRCAVVCPSGKVSEVMDSFKRFGRNLDSIDCLESSFLAAW